MRRSPSTKSGLERKLCWRRTCTRSRIMAKESGSRGKNAMGASKASKATSGLLQRGKDTASYLLHVGEQVAATVVGTLKPKARKAEKTLKAIAEKAVSAPELKAIAMKAATLKPKAVAKKASVLKPKAAARKAAETPKAVASKAATTLKPKAAARKATAPEAKSRKRAAKK
jgi:hypothetical protein